MRLDGKIALVTGASRGVGKGIALALGSAGATVCVSGRSVEEGQTGALPGTITATAEAIDARGGRGIAMVCDHRDDNAVIGLIERVYDDHGKIDLLVNNVFAVPDGLLDQVPFWERPISEWDDMIDLGLRAHYVACHRAAPLMVAQNSGLIINISSPGAVCYMHSPVYGIGKAGCDKLTEDLGKELREFNIAVVGLWPGIVKTERTLSLMDAAPEAYEPLSAGLETPEFAGRVIAALANDDNCMQRSGRAWYTSELAAEYGVKDIDGRQPASYREFLGGPREPSEAMIR